MILSSEVIFFYADHSISLHVLLQISQWAGAVLSAYRSTSSLSPSKEQLYFPLRQISDIGSIQPMQAARLYMSDQQVLHSHPILMSGANHMLTVYGTDLEATHPKDHVYALLGVSALDMVPCYDERISVADVYTEYCAEVVSKTLRTPRPILPALEFIRYGGLVNGSPGQYDLPTWVPNFPVCSERTLQHQTYM